MEMEIQNSDMCYTLAWHMVSIQWVLFSIINPLNPQGHSRSQATSLPFIDEGVNTLGGQDTSCPQSPALFIMPSQKTNGLLFFEFIGLFPLIAQLALSVTRITALCCPPSSVFGGAKWYLEITHRYLELSNFHFQYL